MLLLGHAMQQGVKAETMLGIMVNCLHGGPKFLTNMIPVVKLNTQFLVNKSIRVLNLLKMQLAS